VFLALGWRKGRTSWERSTERSTVRSRRSTREVTRQLTVDKSETEAINIS